MSVTILVRTDLGVTPRPETHPGHQERYRLGHCGLWSWGDGDVFTDTGSWWRSPEDDAAQAPPVVEGLVVPRDEYKLARLRKAGVNI